jgi:hypothetical protein
LRVQAFSSKGVEGAASARPAVWVNVVAGSPLPKRSMREVWISVSFLAALGSSAADAVADRVYKRTNV